MMKIAENDRDMLEYLSEACESQVYVCDQCGHEEALSTFDIASDLRDYMATEQRQGDPDQVESTPECFCVEHGLHIETLRAQLAERDALLVKANYVIDHARAIDKQAFGRGTQNVDPGLFRGLGNLLAQYDEALSASAKAEYVMDCPACCGEEG